MNATIHRLLATSLALGSAAAQAPEPEEIHLEGFLHGRYFLVDPPQGADAPKAGHGVLVVLPGGTGGDDFLPFVSKGIRSATPDDHLVVMVPSVQWTEDQQIVWPTRRRPTLDMKYPTEDLVDAVVADVAKRRAVDAERVHLLAWSSSGPAAYEIALQEKQPFSGFYVAMSVFRPDEESLPHAEGLRFVLDQSPHDEITPFKYAQRARDDLAARGAAVWLRSYAGGHGWHDDPIARVRSGLAWLESDEPVPAGDDDWSHMQPLQNGSFELGTQGWSIVDNSGMFHADVVGDEVRDGSKALRLRKDGGASVDLVRQEVALPDAPRVRVSVQARAEAARNVFVKFFVYGKDGTVLNNDVDLAELRGDLPWRRYTKTYELGENAAYGVVMFVVARDGTVWADDVRVDGSR